MKKMKKLDIQKLAVELPIKDQLELAHLLLEHTLPPLTAQEKAEVKNHWAAYQDNPDDVFSAEHVHAEMLERLHR